MKPTDFRFHHHLRVRWAEVDMQKIVFNPHYLMYFDCAIADYWRALAMPYEAAMQLLDGDIFLRKTTVEFNASARMDDRLDVALRCDRIGNSSMTFVGAIFRDGQLLNAGELVYVFADPATQTSRPVPAPLRALIEAYESGQPVTQVQTGDWATLQQPASSVRTAVFVEEQGIAREDEWDAADATAVHAVVTNLLGMPVATGMPSRLVTTACTAVASAASHSSSRAMPCSSTNTAVRTLDAGCCNVAQSPVCT